MAIDLSNAVAGAVTGGLSLVGIPWQQRFQKELMHENESINLAQWNRENEYNSPAAQMKRLKEAGLNPDLAIQGNVSNTSGNMTPTEGTPHAPNAAGAVGSGVANALNAALVGSQIEKNEADAKNASASAGEHEVNTEFKNLTMKPQYELLLKHLGCTDAQTKKYLAEVDALQAQGEQLLKLVSKYEAEIGLIRQRTATERFNTRLTGWNSDLAYKKLQWYDTEMSNLVKLWASECGVNDAHAANIRTQTNFLLQTFVVRQSLLENENTIKYYEAKFHPQQRYLSALADFQEQQTLWLPYQVLSSLGGDISHLEYNEDGTFKTDVNGMPVVKQRAINFDRSFKFVGEAFDMLGDAGSAFFGFGVGGAALKGIKAGKAAIPAAGAAIPAEGAAVNSSLYKQWQGALQRGDQKTANRLYKQMTQ